jgi:catechol 2,3-dioxygenase-like lactoylglutathione lyase family enzyme
MRNRATRRTLSSIHPLNPFGHIDLRVRDLDEAVAFYDRLLPELGFTRRFHGELWKTWATADPLPATAAFALTHDADHRPNANRIAFWVGSREEVDRLARVAGEAGATLSGPKPMRYSPGYYAVFFADPSGNELEVYFRPD